MIRIVFYFLDTKNQTNNHPTHECKIIRNNRCHHKTHGKHGKCPINFIPFYYHEPSLSLKNHPYQQTLPINWRCYYELKSWVVTQPVVLMWSIFAICSLSLSSTACKPLRPAKIRPDDWAGTFPVGSVCSSSMP